LAILEIHYIFGTLKSKINILCVTLYAEKEWLHIYTDGSLTDQIGYTGAGIHCKVFSFYLTLGLHATHCIGEVDSMDIVPI
jgi:hypothetical protein